MHLELLNACKDPWWQPKVDVIERDEWQQRQCIAHDENNERITTCIKEFAIVLQLHVQQLRWKFSTDFIDGWERLYKQYAERKEHLQRLQFLETTGGIDRSSMSFSPDRTEFLLGLEIVCSCEIEQRRTLDEEFASERSYLLRSFVLGIRDCFSHAVRQLGNLEDNTRCEIVEVQQEEWSLLLRNSVLIKAGTLMTHLLDDERLKRRKIVTDYDTKRSSLRYMMLGGSLAICLKELSLDEEIERTRFTGSAKSTLAQLYRQSTESLKLLQIVKQESATRSSGVQQWAIALASIASMHFLAMKRGAAIHCFMDSALRLRLVAYNVELVTHQQSLARICYGMLFDRANLLYRQFLGEHPFSGNYFIDSALTHLVPSSSRAKKRTKEVMKGKLKLALSNALDVELEDLEVKGDIWKLWNLSFGKECANKLDFLEQEAFDGFVGHFVFHVLKHSMLDVKSSREGNGKEVTVNPAFTNAIGSVGGKGCSTHSESGPSENDSQYLQLELMHNDGAQRQSVPLGSRNREAGNARDVCGCDAVGPQVIVSANACLVAQSAFVSSFGDTNSPQESQLRRSKFFFPR